VSICAIVVHNRCAVASRSVATRRTDVVTPGSSTCRPRSQLTASKIGPGTITRGPRKVGNPSPQLGCAVTEIVGSLALLAAACWNLVVRRSRFPTWGWFDQPGFCLP
jgi:hypothetical protein